MGTLRQQSSPQPLHAQADERSVQSLQNNPPLQDYVHAAIGKYVRKVTRYEKAVIADRDPENLHQMRVGMRRLRTALKTYGAVLRLPKAAREPQVAKVARRLGTLRDIDVLLETLEKQYWPALPFSEQLQMAKVMEVLHGDRQTAFRRAKSTLEGESYQGLKKSIRAWLRAPTYRPLGQLPLSAIAPEFIQPLLSRLWLHPGWLIGAEFQSDRFVPNTKLSPEVAEALLSEKGTPLHALRKQVKRVRYQLDFCEDWLGKPLQPELKRMSHLQDALGVMQDTVVLEQFLDKALDKQLKDLMPTVASILVQTRHRAWLDWQPLQEHYLQARSRHEIYRMMLVG
ncbi:MAG: CHAD domain-containing protein [Synechococcus sp.]